MANKNEINIMDELMSAVEARVAEAEKVAEQKTAERKERVLVAMKKNIADHVQPPLSDRLSDILPVVDSFMRAHEEALEKGTSVYFGRVENPIASEVHEGFTLYLGENPGIRPFVLGIEDTTRRAASKLRNFLSSRTGIDREAFEISKIQELMENVPAALKVVFKTPADTNAQVKAARKAGKIKFEGFLVTPKDCLAVLTDDGLLITRVDWWQGLPRDVKDTTFYSGT